MPGKKSTNAQIKSETRKETTTAKNCSLQTIPIDIQQLIFNYLNTKELFLLKSICKDFINPIQKLIHRTIYLKLNFFGESEYAFTPFLFIVQVCRKNTNRYIDSMIPMTIIEVCDFLQTGVFNIYRLSFTNWCVNDATSNEHFKTFLSLFQKIKVLNNFIYKISFGDCMASKVWDVLCTLNKMNVTIKFCVYVCVH